jgi:two-component system phosphate regulon sensor histidine kinase PhoR
MAFRESIRSLQVTKLKLDRMADSQQVSEIIIHKKQGADQPVRINIQPDRKMEGLVEALDEKVKDTFLTDKTIVYQRFPSDTSLPTSAQLKRRNRLMQFLYDVDSLQDSIKVKEIYAGVDKRLQQQNIEVPFSVMRLNNERENGKDNEKVYNEVTIGFKNPITYKLDLENTFPFLIKRIAAAILLSLFLVAFTIVSFALLYRNVLKQKRLAEIKNDFISNITHELKTPIATVSVAIEALRTFNASMDAKKTKEYLDISANELQRLSLLVDKVLKLSMFEKKEIELQYEILDVKALVEEVTSSMRLQFEKHQADVHLSAEGDTILEGDRLHLVSVIFNLLDNALKYTNGSSPQITIQISGGEDQLQLSIADNGIGIPAEYRDKVFEKFFRVPTGNLHNAKGYGLGLSYVNHVVDKHKGTIKVESFDDNGCNFIITLPKHAA